MGSRLGDVSMQQVCENDTESRLKGLAETCSLSSPHRTWSSSSITVECTSFPRSCSATLPSTTRTGSFKEFTQALTTHPYEDDAEYFVRWLCTGRFSEPEPCFCPDFDALLDLYIFAGTAKCIALKRQILNYLAKCSSPVAADFL